MATAVLAGCGASVRSAAGTPPCNPAEAERRWIQEALDGWHRVTSAFLEIAPTPLPWVVLFDEACVWHLAADPTSAMRLPLALPPGAAILSYAGEPVPVRVGAHGGAIALPNGSELPIERVAFTSLYGEDVPFFVMALPEVWRGESHDASGLPPEEMFLGVLAHEMTHTRQLATIAARIGELGDRERLPAQLDDDVVQTTFDSVAGFRAAWEEERDLLYAAAAETDLDRSRSLGRDALGRARARRERWFTGPSAVYAELEDLFLLLEGPAEWASLQLLSSRAPRERATEVLAGVRSRFWVQDEGLALFLVIDALLPGWQRRVLGPEPPSAFALLEEAIAAP